MTNTVKTLTIRAGCLAALGLSAGAITACSADSLEGAKLCKDGAPKVVRAIPFTSKSDLELAKRIAPDAAREIADFAADSCASLRVGVADNNPEADLVLRTVDLQPRRDRAPNRGPYIAEQVARAKKLLNAELARLDKTPATAGSPLLNTLVAVSNEAVAAGEPAGCTATFLISDGFAWETIAGVRLNLYRKHIPQQDIDKIKGYLKRALRPLSGGVVVIMGAGGDGPGGGAGARAEAVMRELLDAAGIKLVWARSTDVAAGCRS